ncbi:probable 18S rRNA (guanine-N(7))-methyltransferase [Ixodes scapularis]|nr:probable 18S rRNA (guanine-N(7))-methyltransferase [Ixodes scapularis]
MARRPEYAAPPEIFYNEQEAAKYTSNSRIMEIQSAMSERAIELLALPEDECHFILDLGCGSGLSGDVLEEQGHVWVGVDISQAMLNVALEREASGDMLLGDLGHGVCFRAGAFDGAISISALQWLCNADKKSHNPVQRLHKFFSSLYACLCRGKRAVFQFYPENSDQIELVTQQAMKAGFTGGLVVDYPNSSKAKKMFLVLFTGGPQKLPTALGAAAEAARSQIECTAAARRDKLGKLRGKGPKHGAAWIQEKKERRRRQGKETKPDSKYTGRRRCGKF